MSTFAQTNDGDLALTNKQLTLVRGGDELAVRMRNRTYTVRGEWYQNTRTGIPYYELVWVKNPRIGIIKSVFQKAYETLPGIKELAKLEVSLNNSTRALAVALEAISEDGSRITSDGGDFIVDAVAE